MVEKICIKGEFWAWNETVKMEGESGEQVGGEKSRYKSWMYACLLRIFNSLTKTVIMAVETETAEDAL